MKKLSSTRLLRSAHSFGRAAIVCLVAMPWPGIAEDATQDRPADVIRFATFNAALSGQTAADLPGRLATPDDEKLKKVAAIIQHVRPDVLLINEFDHDPTGQLAADFQQHYLGIVQGGNEPIAFTHAYSPPVNTGLPTGIDLNGDGKIGGPADAHGWGDFPGQYGMLLLSRLNDLPNVVESQRERLWMGDHVYGDENALYPETAKGILRLSSKTHETIRITRRNGRPVYVIISHPTPPVFDGPEDRNGHRNAEEIQLLNEMVAAVHPWRMGAIEPRHEWGPVVILGDLNADPHDGESRKNAVRFLFGHRLMDPLPRSRGAVEKSLADGGINTDHQTDPALDTADWHDHGPHGSGNLRVDYVLPTKDWRVVDAGVFWPTADEPGHEWIDASDHRLVWVDLTLALD
ncbi:MAG: endonuclease/exonuclease/phosphatase family protein [Planctomycetota bacterium]